MNNVKNLFNILLSDKPSELIKYHEKEILLLIPELEKSKGFNQNNEWHIYDVYEHILHVIDGVPNNLALRLAALFHDIGKPYVYKEDENKIGHFYNHWNKSNEIFLKFCNKFNIHDDLKNKVSKLIVYHDLNFSKLEQNELQKVLKLFSKEDIKLLFELKKSDLHAQANKYHYLISEYEIQEKNLLLLK